MIEGGDGAPVAIMRTVFDPGIARGQLGKDGARRFIVGRVVVQLAHPVGHGLSQEAGQRAAQQMRTVAGEQEDAEASHGVTLWRRCGCGPH